MTDSHAHLEACADDAAALVDRARAAGVTRIVTIGTGIDSCRAALAIAGTLGEEVVFVLGEPAYYTRFGFSAEAAAPFASPYAGPYFMALWLRPPPAAPASGSAAYAPAFGALGEP